jgi:flavin reductase (DIM6/NTAB) family NADH-FMN oxidoreductase RutF
MIDGQEQRRLLRRWPTGISVVVADVGGRKAGLTVSSLVSLSLTPPLIGISLALSASLYEVFRRSDQWALSILAGDQAPLAVHFASSLASDVQWDGIAVRDDDPRLIAGAVGWIVAHTVGEVAASDHTFFVGEVESVEQGAPGSSLMYFGSEYREL